MATYVVLAKFTDQGRRPASPRCLRTIWRAGRQGRRKAPSTSRRACRIPFWRASLRRQKSRSKLEEGGLARQICERCSADSTRPTSRSEARSTISPTAINQFGHATPPAAKAFASKAGMLWMPSLSSFALALPTRSDCLLAHSGLIFPSNTYFMATSTVD